MLKTDHLDLDFFALALALAIAIAFAIAFSIQNSYEKYLTIFVVIDIFKWAFLCDKATMPDTFKVAEIRSKIFIFNVFKDKNYYIQN